MVYYIQRQGEPLNRKKPKPGGFMKYTIQNRNFSTCKPEACQDNGYEGYDNGYKNALPVGEYTAFAVSYTPDGGKSFTESWYLTDSDDVETSNTTEGDQYRRICRVWRVKFDGERIRRIEA
jgi:hypothetical protein